MKTILDLSYSKARDFLMEPKNYCNLSLPSYIDFKPLLDYVRSSIGQHSFQDCLAKGKSYPSKFDNVNYSILVNKDGRYSFRQMQLVNPFLYYFLVRTITEKSNWKAIKDRLQVFKDTHIEVCSLPIIKRTEDKTTKASIVENWWERVEQRSIELSLVYKYMFVTDITNCYGSIYTHAISWALMGKDKAKATIGKSSLGNTIDTYIEGMQYGQTNGIPQGSVLFDFIAEIVLGYADFNLKNELSNLHTTDYHIVRYRDDYRIFSNNKDELETIAIVLQTVLADLNFQMNNSKTKLSNNIIEDAIKPDKLFYNNNTPIYLKHRSLFNSFQKELLYILMVSRRYPNSGTVCRLMTNICRRIQHCKVIRENLIVLIAITTEIAITSPKIYQQSLACISSLINLIDDEAVKKLQVQNIYLKLRSLPNIGHIQLWMQRITYKLDVSEESCPYDEPLCKFVYGEKVDIWNLSWLKSSFSKGFPLQQMCNKTKLDAMTAFIDVGEIDIFNY